MTTEVRTPTPFLSTRAALRWYWSEVLRRSSPPALPLVLSPGGGQTGMMQRIDADGLSHAWDREWAFCTVAGCIKAFGDPRSRENLVLLWRFGGGTEVQAETADPHNPDAVAAWREQLGPIARRAAAYLRNHGMIP